eukprot:4966112-Amphidinium_carterae.1
MAAPQSPMVPPHPVLVLPPLRTSLLVLKSSSGRAAHSKLLGLAPTQQPYVAPVSIIDAGSNLSRGDRRKACQNQHSAEEFLSAMALNDSASERKEAT